MGYFNDMLTIFTETGHIEANLTLRLPLIRFSGVLRTITLVISGAIGVTMMSNLPQSCSHPALYESVGDARIRFNVGSTRPIIFLILRESAQDRSLLIWFFHTRITSSALLVRNCATW